MNEVKEPRRKKEDEVDLRLVFEKIGNGLNRLSSTIIRYFKLAKRNLFLVLAVILISIGLGYAYYKAQRPFYRSSMTLMLNKIRNEFVEDQMRRLTDLVSDGNYKALASRLEISTDAASQIRSFKFRNIDEDRIPDDSILAGAPFLIELSVYDNELFTSMEPAIVNYLENNQFFSKQKQIRENETRKVIAKLKNDITSIDSVKENLVAPKGPINGFIYGEALDPTELYRESINMYKEQVILESNLDRLNNIEVINSFVPRIKPSGPSLNVYLGVAGLIGLIIGLVLASKLEKRRRGV